MPTPSAPSGYYDSSFTLKLDAPSSGTVYYTLDGSTPTVQSLRYDGGILLTDRTQEPNVCNAVRNIVPDWKAYTPKPAPVPKGTVVRAIFVNSWGIQSEVLTQTYFIGLEQPERGYTLSLSFEHEDFYGDNGIYVTGPEYDKWYLSGDPDTPAPTPNYEKDLEVPVTMELISDEGQLLNQAAGIRLQGASARAEKRKRFTLVSRIEYSGSQYFDIPLFGDIPSHSVMLKTYLPDAISADLLGDRSAAVQQSIPVRVYLNGEFLYDTYMLERYDSHYFLQHYQVEDRVLVRNGKMDEESLLDPRQDNYGAFLERIRTADFTDPAQWELLQQEISLQSFIDYMIAQYFFCNIDFHDTHNYVLWRSPNLRSTPYSDMRWRWCLYDIDALVWIPNKPSRGKPETINVFSNEVRTDMHDISLYHALHPNPEFRRQFVLSYMDILNNNLSVTNVTRILEKYGQTQDWQDGYFLKRPAYATAHLAEEFGLTGTLETVTVSTSDSDMGSVVLNTSRIDLSSGTWSGSYFTDYPVTLTATSADGYRFVGWKGDASTDSPVLTLPVDGGVAVEAVFEAIQ